MTEPAAACAVWLGDERVGTLLNTSVRGGDRNVFVFDEGYRRNPRRSTLSLSFYRDGELVESIPSARTHAPAFFTNLLPEGALRTRIARSLGQSGRRDFPLLNALGADLPGAVRLTPLSESVAADLRSEPETALRFSLAGVQLKMSAVMDDGKLSIPAHGLGGEFIIKIPGAYPGLAENEHWSMRFAAAIGCEVPATGIARLGEVRGIDDLIQTFGSEMAVFYVKRFDRSEHGRVHAEDFAQITETPPNEKYGASDGSVTCESIARLLLSNAGDTAYREFLRRLVLCDAIGNGDMHLKNWSVIYRDPQVPELAPVYDMVATSQYFPNETMALSFGGSKAWGIVERARIERFTAALGISSRATLRSMNRAFEEIVTVWGDSMMRDVPERSQGHLSERLRRLRERRSAP